MTAAILFLQKVWEMSEDNIGFVEQVGFYLYNTKKCKNKHIKKS